ncbi:hypothetical protein C8J57DRAFT_3781 [Mycena rebaudengoi]|nr:hypothetical protein C8J57DRAFT_3781 [Mycena rebaudengoi]
MPLLILGHSQCLKFRLLILTPAITTVVLGPCLAKPGRRFQRMRYIYAWSQFNFERRAKLPHKILAALVEAYETRFPRIAATFARCVACHPRTRSSIGRY